jgi:ATP-dependent DNA helicase RecG
MQTLQEIIITEATEHEFKVELEEKRPKSWLKTVSAFANGQGGSFYIGVNDDGEVRGLDDIKSVSDKISNFIKERISPLPIFNLSAHRVEDGKEILVLQVPRGEIPPYYYTNFQLCTIYPALIFLKVFWFSQGQHAVYNRPLCS